MLTSVAVVAVVGCSALALLGGISDRQRAQQAADLAAMSAAREAGLGAERACAQARTVVIAHAAQLRQCVVEPGGVVMVVVVVEGTGPVRPAVQGIARAGPDLE